MKTYRIISILALSLSLVAVSCTKDFENANRPGGAISQKELQRDNYALGAFLVQLENQAFPEQENTYQMNVDLIGNYCGRFMMYANNGFANNNFTRMNAPTGWANYPFNDCTPKVVSAFNEIKTRTEGEGVVYALALALRAQSFLRLTDIYGPYPIGIESDENAYSSQEAVYKSLLGDLEQSEAILGKALASDANATTLEDQDMVYSGKISQWYKFVNSLRLRMAIRMRFADPATAQSVAEAAVAAGVITDNADNTAITYYPNGQYKTSVDWGDSRACADLDAFLNGYKDPRASKYFNAPATAGDRSVIGLRAGALVQNKNTAMALYSAANISADSRGVWMTAAEMTFCRAEGALLGWNMGGTAGDLYNKAVSLSFEQWGAGSADAYLADDTSVQADYTNPSGGYGANAAHVSSVTIKWDDNASAETKLERLITQKWIALFPEGQEAWCEIRRTGYPKVFPAISAAYAIDVPNRVPFCSTESTNNPANYAAAVALLGGEDTYATRLWWQR